MSKRSTKTGATKRAASGSPATPRNAGGNASPKASSKPARRGK